MSKHTAITLEVIKDRTNLFLKIKATKELEEFFKQLATEHFAQEQHAILNKKMFTPLMETPTQISEKWFDDSTPPNGLEFYKTTPKLDEFLAQFQSKHSSLPVCNNFGNGLTYNGQTNIALLRIVGISDPKGIKINTSELVAYDELMDYIKNLAEITKLLYQSFIKKIKVKATIAFEV